MFYQIAFNAGENNLCFRVAHAAVIFNHIRLAGAVSLHGLHQPDVYKTFISYLVFLQALYGGYNNAVFYLLHQLIIYKRHRRNTTHTTRVKARISLTYAL